MAVIIPVPETSKAEGPGDLRPISVYLFIYFIYYWIYIPPTCSNTSERSAGSQIWYLGPFSGFSCASDRPFVIECQVCSLSTKSQVSITLHYTITVCCNSTAHSQHCLPASEEARELKLKYDRATAKSNPGPFALAAECITTRPPRLSLVKKLLKNRFGWQLKSIRCYFKFECRQRVQFSRLDTRKALLSWYFVIKERKLIAGTFSGCIRRRG